MSRRFRLPLAILFTFAGLVFFCGLNYCCNVSTIYCAVTDPDEN